MSRARDDSLRSNICKRMALFYLIRARSKHRTLVPEPKCSPILKFLKHSNNVSGSVKTYRSRHTGNATLLTHLGKTGQPLLTLINLLSNIGT